MCLYNKRWITLKCVLYWISKLLQAGYIGGIFDGASIIQIKLEAAVDCLRTERV